MAGWPAIYLYQRSESGRTGFVGFAVVLVSGMALTVGFPTVLLLIYPWLSPLHISNHTLDTGPVSFDVFFGVASGLVSLGGVVFGIATVRARVFSGLLGRSFIVVVDQPAPGRYVVASGFGQRAQWFRNIQASPSVRVFIGARGPRAATARVSPTEYRRQRATPPPIA